MVPAGNKAKTTFVDQPKHKKNSSIAVQINGLVLVTLDIKILML